MKKNSKGITLIALVVTIVILLILAEITIASVIGNDGLINRAKEAANKTTEGLANDIKEIDNFNQELEELIGEYEDMRKTAKINDTRFESLQEAINSVNNNNTPVTIILLRDIAENVVIKENQNIILNLNNKKIINANEQPVINLSGTVEIKNGTIRQ